MHDGPPASPFPTGLRMALLLLVALVLFAPTKAQAQAQTEEPQLLGHVVDDSTGEGVARARVDLLDGRTTRVRASALSDVDGAFDLGAVPAGSFRLRVQHVGYRPTTTPFWYIEAGELLAVEIRVSADVVVVAPLEIVGRVRSTSPVLEGFYFRMDRGVGGTFFSREDIERESPDRLSDLVLRAPGVQIASSSGTGLNRILTMTRSLPGRQGGCPVQVFVDGTLASRSGAIPIDELARPGDLEGVEIYRGVGSVPAIFLTPDARCGVIALWTRRGG